MFKKKKDSQSKYNTSKHIKEFDQHLREKDEKEHYEKMYNHIKMCYIDEIKKNVSFINVERVRLQAKTGKYNVLKKSFSINLIVLGISVFINSITLAVSVSSYKIETKFHMIIGLGFIAYSMLIYAVIKNMEKANTFILDLSLQVLEDIAKEKAEKEKNIEEQNDKEKIYKKIEEVVNRSNIFDNVIIPTIFEVAAGTVKKDGWARRLFSKKK